jgi:hypothetical protein
MMEAVGTCGTSAHINETTRRYIPEDNHLHIKAEVLEGVKMSMVFWVAMPSETVCRYGVSMFFRNADIYLQVHMALQPKIPTSMGQTLFAICLKCLLTAVTVNLF